MVEKNPATSVESDSTQSFPNVPEDEISLFDVIGILGKKKVLILFITLIFTLVATSYSFWLTPLYKARVGLFPLSEAEDLDATEATKVVFRLYIDRILSYRYQREIFDRENFLEKFVDDVNDTAGPDYNLQEIHDSIKTSTGVLDRNAVSPVYIKMEGSKPKVMSDFLNMLTKGDIQEEGIDKLIDRTKKLYNQLINQYNPKIQHLRAKAKLDRLNKISELEEADKRKRKEILDEIDRYRFKEKMYRLDRIERLTRFLTIARNLGIKDRKFSDVHTRDIPLWHSYGESGLEAEIEELKSRTNGDPFITQLPELHSQLKKLDVNRTVGSLKSRTNDDPHIKGITTLQSNFAVNVFDGKTFDEVKRLLRKLPPTRLTFVSYPSIPPLHPIEPNKYIIIFSGFVLGLITGIMAAFIKHTMEKYRDELLR